MAAALALCRLLGLGFGLTMLQPGANERRMIFWAVSDVSAQEFKAFVGLVRDQVASTR